MTTPKFTTTQLKYIEILANPENAHLKETEIAERVGVSRQTLHHWKRNKPELMQEVYKLAYENLNREIPKVYAALSRKAISGNIKAVELYLKFIGKYVEKTETNISADVDFSNISDSELEKALAEYERVSKLNDN